MYLSSLNIHQLRVIEKAELELSSGVNIIVGNNGSGKTSLLEAISILSQGRSFRASRISQLLPKNSNSLSVTAKCIDKNNIKTMIGIEKKKA